MLREEKGEEEDKNNRIIQQKNNTNSFIDVIYNIILVFTNRCQRATQNSASE